MQKFNLEAAKKGAKVCTRKGKKARIICYDVVGPQPLMALVSVALTSELPFSFNKDGTWLHSHDNSRYDLMMEDDQ